MKKSNLLPAIVLSSICVVVALLLAVVNTFTAPEIAKNKKEKEIKALQEVLPAGTYFDPIEITDAYPDVIAGGYKSDAGFVFKAEVKGYKPGLTIMVGVDNEGKIAGVKHTASKETFGAENELNSAYTEKKDSSESLEMILSASASKGAPLTSKAYYQAVNSALEAALIASGNKAEEKYQGVESVQLTDEGNYVFVAYSDGFVDKIVIEVCISADGKIIYSNTLSHKESNKYGKDLLNSSSFYESFVGAGSADISGIEISTNATGTSNGFKRAIKNAFDAFEIIKAEGGIR